MSHIGPEFSGKLTDGFWKGVYAYDVIFDGTDGQTEGWADVAVSDGIIRSVTPSLERNEHWIAPGLIDLQVNGGGGVMFSDDPTEQALQKIGEAHRRFGTTQWMPTLISRPEPVICQAAMTVADNERHGVIGLHVEGPFFAKEKAGAHDLQYIRPFDRLEVQRWTGTVLPANRLLMTVAPEKLSVEDMAWLQQQGIRWFAGHSSAEASQMKVALDNGCAGGTHLFNAMPAIVAREPALTGVLLTDDRAWTTLIADGQHVDPVNLQLACRMKKERLLLVSDAMPATGTKMPSFLMDGRYIARTGNSRLEERWINLSGVLAGACLPLYEMVCRLQYFCGISRGEALAMAGSRVAAFLGLSGRYGAIASGRTANLIIGREDGSLHTVIADGAEVPDVSYQSAVQEKINY